MGNMISDFVKGKRKYDYPEQIQQGIAVHREIDRFTDTHPVTKEAKEIFRPSYRLYAGSLMDVIYDHFLALDGNDHFVEMPFVSRPDTALPQAPCIQVPELLTPPPDRFIADQHAP